MRSIFFATILTALLSCALAAAQSYGGNPASTFGGAAPAGIGAIAAPSRAEYDDQRQSVYILDGAARRSRKPHCNLLISPGSNSNFMMLLGRWPLRR